MQSPAMMQYGKPVYQPRTMTIPFTRKIYLLLLRDLHITTFFSITIQLSRGVKYFGLMPDKQLTWKKQLDNIIKMVTGRFGHTEACLGKPGH
jgi:hypothetical protein